MWSKCININLQKYAKASFEGKSKTGRPMRNRKDYFQENSLGVRID
jgi:hypothetical protein